MKPPGLDDTAVRVTAWLTDDTFGYDHWRAAQFSAPQCARHGVLVLFETAEAADEFLRRKPGGTP